MRATEYNFSVRHGDHIRRRVRIRRRGVAVEEYLDFTGYTGRAQIRDEDNDALVGTFTVSVVDEDVDIDDVATSVSHIEIYLSGEDSEGLPIGRLPYDVEMTDPSGDPLTWIEGHIRVEEDTTRD